MRGEFELERGIRVERRPRAQEKPLAWHRVASEQELELDLLASAQRLNAATATGINGLLFG
jgi:hypothetical protein